MKTSPKDYFFTFSIYRWTAGLLGILRVSGEKCCTPILRMLFKMLRIFLTLALLAAVQCKFGGGFFHPEYYYEGESESESESSESSSESSSDTSSKHPPCPCTPLEVGQCCDDCHYCKDENAICDTYGYSKVCICKYGFIFDYECKKCVTETNMTTTTTPPPNVPIGGPCGRSANDCIRSAGIKCENVICCNDNGWPACSEKFCVCETAKGYKYDDALGGCNYTGENQHELSKDCNNSAGEMANLG
ncbi:hypothetical protein MAR_032238 [Mya arenaria]|uniref:Uncharacterized protein n=1 Tax=Mya arenaria TaxID=6604 RepID=A0ABY7FA23_MYAAR|nr:uncharacterized protein LOC128204158 isoform X1 [Mya arenaria]WAR17644.1 hypothetical protein MAR_032238 [Mya arenaria]